ncbi:MAG: lysylphosphatidylglycerol synthase transmembrane domain-containing protein [Anaerolineales bacterium]
MMRRRVWLAVAQTLLGVGLLAAWLWIIDLEAVAKTLQQARWGYVLFAAVLGMASSIVRAVRWRLVLKPIAPVPRLDVWLIGLASSLINFVIPIRSGEIARSFFLKQRDSVPISASLPTVAVDRSFDMLAMLTIGAVGILAGLRIQASLTVVFVLAGGLFLGFAIFVTLAIFWQKRLLRAAEWAVPRFIGENLRTRMLGILSGILIGFTAIGRQPRSLVPLITISFAAALLDAGLFFLLFLSVGNPVPPLVALTGYALFAITFLVPGGPGYIGSMEAFGSLVFGGALGVPQAAAASVILIFHALTALILGIFGGIAIWALGFRPSSAFRSVVDAQSVAGIPSSGPQPSAEG